MNYTDFLEKKQVIVPPSGFEPLNHENSLFDWQKAIVNWAVRKGRSAIFADCGLGKTIMQLEWAWQVWKYTNCPVLVLAPLAVASQTKREGAKFGYDVAICRTQKDIVNGINITNYEMLEHFNTGIFGGIVLDESSILKSFTGKTKQLIIDSFSKTPYRLACTATPSPNDYMELGNHSEFLGIMSRTEMLATYFVHDGGDTAKWRLKGHAEHKFWEWLGTWSVVIKNPADIGFDGCGFDLPPLNIETIFVDSPIPQDRLFPDIASTLSERREARKESMETRVRMAASIANSFDEPVLVWCDFNAESELLSKSIVGAVEVKGSDSPHHKENTAVLFANNEIKALVSKSSIYGFGMNWQNCCNIIFCGISDSYEQFYQAVRRCWRFGQTREVNVYIIISEREESVLQNIKRKQADAERMGEEMLRMTSEITKAEINKTVRITTDYTPQLEMTLPEWIGGIAN